MGTNDVRLYDISDEYLSALEEFVEGDNGDIPDEVWLDTLEALEGGVVDKGRNVTAFALELKKKSEMIDNRIKELQARKKTIDNKVEWFRRYLKTNMDKTGITKIEAVDGSFSVSISKPVASVIVDDVESLPDEFIREKVTRSADKVGLKKALEAGMETKGAHLEYSPRLTIR